MSKEDIAKVALGAPALHEVFIVSTPDCLLVRSWAPPCLRESSARQGLRELDGSLLAIAQSWEYS